jgi:hypothetical protein
MSACSIGKGGETLWHRGNGGLPNPKGKTNQRASANRIANVSEDNSTPQMAEIAEKGEIQACTLGLRAGPVNVRLWRLKQQMSAQTSVHLGTLERFDNCQQLLLFQISYSV